MTCNVNTCDISELFETKLDVLNAQFSDDDKAVFAERVATHFHNVLGFPYYNKEELDIHKEFKKCKNYEPSRLELEDNQLQQVMHGLNICNLYHPHMWKVRCRKFRTPFEVFEDKELLKKALLKRLKMSDCKLRPFSIRKALKIYSGTQSVSNFKPTIARYIYEKYAGDNAIVLDPCTGYGGRLLGAMLADNVAEYHGTDPCIATYDGNREMIQDLKPDSITISILPHPFEDTTVRVNKYDLVFTSPPYYNVEQYSDEPTQSWVRYKEYDEWVEGFLRPLITKSYNVLKDGKVFALNVHGDDLIKSSLELAEEIGFTLETTKHMRLSKMVGKGIDKNKTKFKTEPIFILRK